MVKVLSGQGKGALKETLQVFIQELNASELSMRCRNLYRQCQKPREPSLLRDKYRNYLRDKLPVLTLGIEAAGIVYRLVYGTVEAS